jgi:membrane fusion protein (multidrug efflux system)
VKVVDVVTQDVPIYSEWVAQLNGDTNAEIVPKVQGYVLKKNYQEGFVVQQGQLLFEIDPRPFDAALDQAQAELAVSKAEQTKAETDRARDTPLAAQNAIPQKQLDNDISAEAAAKAKVDAANAMVEQAKLNLEWTKVYSPIDGVAGVATSQVGDLVGPTTKMTTISKVDPIRAYFSISENAYLQNSARIAAVVAGSSKSGSVPVEYIEANEVTYPDTGRIILVNREVSSQTGTIQFAAEFPNPQAILRPGGFGRVRIKTADNKGALLVPQPAVIEVQSAYQVVVIGPDNKASFRPVQVGDRVGNNWIITQGLKPGEKVVVEGFQKVRDGMTVAAEPLVQSTVAEGR